MKEVTSDSSAFHAMDRMYRLQRYFYDFTRKYYLLGRDQLLDQMDIKPGETILEAGCGTARNLIVLSKRHPEAKLFGLDASSAMLETARSKTDAANANNIELQTALADDFNYKTTFDLDQPFDKIFFSYSITMIPPWKESLENAMANLRPGGTLYIVDFYDQAGLPGPFKRFLQWWLRKFHVQHWDGLIDYIGSFEERGIGTVEIKPLFRRYLFFASVRKS